MTADATDRERLAEVLHEHVGSERGSRGAWCVKCICGADTTLTKFPGDAWNLHRAHVADALAQMLTEAEQRGREDNADHGMCYVHGSKALDARLAEARAEVVAAVERVCAEAERRSEGNIFGPVDWVTVPAIRAALGSAAHDCGSCPDCLHDGHKCCGCYDGACCKAGAR